MYRRIRATICCLLCALLLAFPLAGPELYALTAGATVQGAAMSVSGQATPGQWVSISVERADGKRCYLGQASADSSGAYSVRFNLNQGTYQVLVASGGQQAQTAQQVIAQNSPGGGGSGGTIIPVPDPATAQALISVVGDSATGTILPATSWQWKGECTVLQALKGVLDGQGIHYQIRSGYVSSIGTLAEKKAGYPLSGWLFRQNGKFPPSGGDSTLLHNGDRIEWLYTLDGGKDLGAPQVSPQPLPEINEQTNKELTAILNNYNSMLADLKGRCQLMNVGQRMTAAEAEALQQRLISNSVVFKQKITTAGAIIYDAQQEIMLLFPENVVGNETLVEVQEKKGDAGISDANFKLLSAIYHLQPDGIKFKGAARMGIRVAIYPGINADKLTPAYYNESSKQWEPLPGIIDLKSGLVIFDTAHFSNFAVVEKHEPEAVKPKTETKAPSPDYSELQKDYPWALVSFKFLYDRGIMVGSDQGFEPGSHYYPGRDGSPAATLYQAGNRTG